MASEYRLPSLGERLIHRYRTRPGQIEAQVVSVSERPRRVSVSVEGSLYPSLSAAAKAVSGQSVNGWIFWGLKRYNPKPREKE